MPKVRVKGVKNLLGFPEDMPKEEILKVLSEKFPSITDTGASQPTSDNPLDELIKDESAPPDNFRNDGTRKGEGYFGKLKRPDGRVSTEISIGVEFEDGYKEIPTLVPTLTKKEIDTLLKLDPGKDKIPEVIKRKAIDHSIKRIRSGNSPFWQEGEEIFTTETETPI